MSVVAFVIKYIYEKLTSGKVMHTVKNFKHWKFNINWCTYLADQFNNIEFLSLSFTVVSVMKQSTE